jgi:hypothetical protein
MLYQLSYLAGRSRENRAREFITISNITYGRDFEGSLVGAVRRRDRHASGVMPDRVYAKSELLSYLEHCRHLARTRIAALNAETVVRRCDYGYKDVTHQESLLSNMRHV